MSGRSAAARRAPADDRSVRSMITLGALVVTLHDHEHHEARRRRPAASTNAPCRMLGRHLGIERGTRRGSRRCTRSMSNRRSSTTLESAALTPTPDPARQQRRPHELAQPERQHRARPEADRRRRERGIEWDVAERSQQHAPALRPDVDRRQAGERPTASDPSAAARPRARAPTCAQSVPRVAKYRHASETAMPRRQSERVAQASPPWRRDAAAVRIIACPPAGRKRRERASRASEPEARRRHGRAGERAGATRGAATPCRAAARSRASSRRNPSGAPGLVRSLRRLAASAAHRVARPLDRRPGGDRREHDDRARRARRASAARRTGTARCATSAEIHAPKPSST